MATDLESFASLSDNDARRIDVVCVGAALMDHIVSAEHSVLSDLGYVPGSMSLVETATVNALRAATTVESQVSGGAEANTAVGVVAFGGTAAFVGAVGTDEVGTMYANDLEAAGVKAVLDYVPVSDADSPASGAAFIIVTPDAERTMLTSLGVAPLLDHRKIDDELLGSAKVIYFSAYGLDFAGASDLVQTIQDGAHEKGTFIAFSLADSFCVNRHRDTIEEILRKGVDLVFCNEAEALSLTGASDVDGAVERFHITSTMAVITLGAEGAVAVTEKEIVTVPADTVDQVVDATGAGDLFAAGVLFGITNGCGLYEAVRLGALSAGEVISHFGARPIKDLRALASSAGLLPAT